MADLLSYYKDRQVLVTGCSSGIGGATAQENCKERGHGSSVWIGGRRPRVWRSLSRPTSTTPTRFMRPWERLTHRSGPYSIAPGCRGVLRTH